MIFAHFQLSIIFQLPKPTEDQIRLLTELFLCGFGDQIARRNGKSDQYNIPSMEDSVKIHPHSGNLMFYWNFFKKILALAKSLPDWVCYQSIEENQKGNTYLRNCIAVRPVSTKFLLTLSRLDIYPAIRPITGNFLYHLIRIQIANLESII